MKAHLDALGAAARAAAILLTISALAGSGCGRPAAADPVNPQQARETLQRVLESWKQGESMDAWQTRQPKVVVQDSDWRSGMKLADYEIQGPGKALDANLHCSVRLTLMDTKRGKIQRSASYVVGTHPVLTVFRDMLR